MGCLCALTDAIILGNCFAGVKVCVTSCFPTDIDVAGCDFDENTFCTWTQSVSDNFNWTLNSRTTHTQGTGPISDQSGAGQWSVAKHILFKEMSAFNLQEAIAHYAWMASFAWHNLFTKRLLDIRHSSQNLA